MPRKLVIVESPAKARTIAGYLGDAYTVEASVGHIRDLPQPSELPADMKKGPFGKFAVDVDHGFEPYYVVDPDKKKKVADLRRALKDADELYLATDEDREGEAIAWHLLAELKPKVPVKRMVFHEITREAIQRALEATREVDERLVDAQETRRILDRLYGYEVSPVLWRKVRQGLSAGRVQSVAMRMVVERERERMAFRAAEYWDVTGSFAHPEPASAEQEGAFAARLVALGEARRGDRPGLRRPRHADHPRRGAAGRGGRHRRRRRAGRRDLRRHEPGDQAVHPPARGAVHHLHAPAGGQPQAADGFAGRDAHRPVAVRERLHHVHADRLPGAVDAGGDRRAAPGRRAVRPGVRAGGAAHLRGQGQGRPGGARGHPARRRLVPHARPGLARAVRRRVPALRADLEAHRRLPDGRRTRLDRDRPAVRRPGGRRAAGVGRPADHRGVRRVRHGHHVPRLPRRLRGGPRRRAVRRRRPLEGQPARGAPARDGRGRRAGRRGPDRRRAPHLAAAPLHRGQPGQGARGARDRPARRRTPRPSR